MIFLNKVVIVKNINNFLQLSVRLCSSRFRNSRLVIQGYDVRFQIFYSFVEQIIYSDLLVTLVAIGRFCSFKEIFEDFDLAVRQVRTLLLLEVLQVLEHEFFLFYLLSIFYSVPFVSRILGSVNPPRLSIDCNLFVFRCLLFLNRYPEDGTVLVIIVLTSSGRSFAMTSYHFLRCSLSFFAQSSLPERL